MATAEQAGSVETRTSWLVATAAVAILSVSFGAPIIVVVALPSIAADLGEARAVPALASSLAYLGAGAGGVPMGWLAGRFGMRPVAIAGGAMVCAGLALASGGEGPYRGALEHFCGGREDPGTLRLLSGDDAN